MAGISNTSRTLEYVRSMGWVCDKVEQFNPYAGKFGKRKDLFGFADLVALGENSIIAIQSCGQSFSEHDRKLMEDEYAAANVLKWLECGGRVILIGWRKVLKKRGGKLKVWAPRIKEYKVEDFKDDVMGSIP